MPVHLSALRRREFLLTVGAGCVAATNSSLILAESVDAETEQDLVFLINDPHIGEKQAVDSPIPTQFRQVISEIIQREQRPAAVVINGDLALHSGEPGDYRHFAKLLNPLRDAGINVHLTMGNHDNRDVFLQTMQTEPSATSAVESRYVSVVKTRHANFFLLDSLRDTLVTQGELGEPQLSWLADVLDRFADKPALIVTHHNPRLGGDPLHFSGGLVDSQPLWDVLVQRPHVKAYVHGHIHDRTFAEHQGIHIINTPATSYVANRDTATTGWTTARLTHTGVTLTTHTNDNQHAWNGTTRELQWRGH